MTDDIDPLDYNEEQLRSMSLEDLEELLKKSNFLKNNLNTKQLTAKTLINSLYGATGNVGFILFNEKIACAITCNGRYFIKKLARIIEAKFQSMIKADRPYVVYGDTDSVTGDTLVRTTHGDIKIEDLYNDLNGYIEERGPDNYIKHVKTKIKAASVNENLKLEHKKITYVMKHKVQKRMFKIKCNGTEVTVTEDHSIMVVRNGELISVKPAEIAKGDKLVRISEYAKLHSIPNDES